jgi:hypothetical protein
MKTLQTVLVGVALLIASAAYADRTFNLDGTVTLKALGQSITDNVNGTLTLFDDGTYIMNADGDISSGIWRQEKKKLQLFQEEPTITEFITELEDELSDAVGVDIAVTSLTGKGKSTFNKNGNLTVKSNSSITFRPGPKEGKPLKVKMSEKLEGTLQ